MSSEHYFIIGIIVFIIVFVIVSKIYRNVQLANVVRVALNRFPRVVSNRDTEKSLKEALGNSRKTTKKEAVIDDLTWRDLDMFSVFQMINLTFSSIGSENLYRRLRSYNFNDSFKDIEAMVKFFEENPKTREQVSYRFAQLGKNDHNFVESYLADPKNSQIANPWQYLVMALMPIFGVGLAFFEPLAGIMVVLVTVITNVITYFRKKNLMQVELSSMSYLVQMFFAAKKLAKIKQPTQEQIAENLKPLAKITKFSGSFAVRSNSEGEIFMEYLNMVFLLPLVSYNFVLNILAKHQKEAQNLWRMLGDLEVSMAILNFRKMMPYTAIPKFDKEMKVTAEDLYHPLLKEPVANGVNWQRSTLVTGSNASGKSTYVKSVAVSCILAQTIHTALAEKFSLPHSLVITSMALEDNIFEGESYFIAEIKSVKRIIARVNKGVPCLCFIDEILKGTNTIERIAASSSIVDWLSGHNSLAFVATHDIELTEILKNECDNVHFSEQVSKEGITFDYLLKQGPSRTRNALALLEVMKYPSSIISEAVNQAQHFDQARSWLNIGEDN